MRKLALSKLVYALVFLSGALAFSYPLVTNIINHQSQTQMISNYRKEVASYDSATYSKLQSEALQYNQFIASLEGNVTDEITEAERSAATVVYMNVLSTGAAIGYVKIPKLDVELPIYRGTSDEVLNLGVGHLERSSLPIGGDNSHAVLMAHRGLPTTRLFRDLDLLEIGDVFLIDTLGNIRAYRVETIKTVLPAEVESLQVQKGRDLCTLVTCEPYMINSHRLLVTGYRIEYQPAYETPPQEGHITIARKYWEYFVIVEAFLLLWMVLFITRRRLRRKTQREKQGDAQKSEQEKSGFCLTGGCVTGGDVPLSRRNRYFPVLVSAQRRLVLTRVAAAFLFLLGLATIIYPIAAQRLNNLNATRMVEAFFAQNDSLAQTDNPSMRAFANQTDLDIGAEEDVGNGDSYSGDNGGGYGVEYSGVWGEGVIGSIRIPKLGLELPIFVGLTNENLSRGIAHLEGTSLPFGGKDTHSVLCGHNGNIANEWFTHIDKLSEGDLFYIRTKEQTLTYRVTVKKVINPAETYELNIRPDEDLITLLTCTQGGQMRLIVTGVRGEEG